LTSRLTDSSSPKKSCQIFHPAPSRASTSPTFSQPGNRRIMTGNATSSRRGFTYDPPVPTDDDELTLGQWLGLQARQHRLLLVSLLAHAVLLVVAPRLWSIQIEGHSRSGRAFFMSAAARDLWIVGIGLLAYLLAGLGVPHQFGMRPPTEGEVTVARWLIRTLGFLTLWAGFAITARVLLTAP
jgi:hypothetical protein